MNDQSHTKHRQSNCPEPFPLLESLPQEKLTLAQEFELGRKIQKKKNSADIETLVLHNMREAFLYAKKVCRAQINDGLIFSVCYRALDRMAKMYQPQKLRFFVYAKVAIRGEISNYQESLAVVRNAVTISSDVIEMDDNMSGKGSELLLITGARPPKVWEPHTNPETDSLEQKESIALIRATMARILNEQEMMIMDLVHKAGFNFQEIARLLGISRSAVQATYSHTLKKVRFELLKNDQTRDC